VKGYLLDTDTCIHALRQDGSVRRTLLSVNPRDVRVSVVTEAELCTGAFKSSSPARTRRCLENFLAPIEILPFESSDAIVYGRVRAALERAGRCIGPLDTLIGAHALARGLILVTGNRREFSRIHGLAVEDWS
jgi:tRNA(fMet)-specific endonuclease VapC